MIGVSSRAKAVWSSVGTLFTLWCHTWTVKQPAPSESPSCLTAGSHREAEQSPAAPEVLPSILFFDLLDWPRFSGLSPRAQIPHPRGKAGEAHPGIAGALRARRRGSVWRHMHCMSQVARCWGSLAWPLTVIWGHGTLTLERKFQEPQEIVHYDPVTRYCKGECEF